MLNPKYTENSAIGFSGPKSFPLAPALKFIPLVQHCDRVPPLPLQQSAERSFPPGEEKPLLVLFFLL